MLTLSIKSVKSWIHFHTITWFLDTELNGKMYGNGVFLYEHLVLFAKSVAMLANYFFTLQMTIRRRIRKKKKDDETHSFVFCVHVKLYNIYKYYMLHLCWCWCVGEVWICGILIKNLNLSIILYVVVQKIRIQYKCTYMLLKNAHFIKEKIFTKVLQANNCIIVQ